jgi:hypothetical protein
MSVMSTRATTRCPCRDASDLRPLGVPNCLSRVISTQMYASIQIYAYTVRRMAYMDASNIATLATTEACAVICVFLTAIYYSALEVGADSSLGFLNVRIPEFVNVMHCARVITDLIGTVIQ